MGAELRPTGLSGEVLALHKPRITLPILRSFPSLFFLGLPGAALLGESVAVGGGLIAAAVAGTVLVWWMHFGSLLTLHSDGIEQRGRFGHKLLRWSDLASFRYRAYQPSAMSYGGGLVGVLVVAAVHAATRSSTAFPVKPLSLTLEGNDGTRIKIKSSIGDFGALLDRVSDIATRVLVPSTIRRFEGGEAIAFGPRLTVQRGIGVVYRGLLGARTLPFEAIEPAQMIANVRFVLRRRGGRRFLSLNVSQLPNVYVLVQLLNHARAQLALPSDAGEIQPTAITAA